MKTINCLIIEDEPLALERMVQYVSKFPFLNLKGSFDNGMDALVFLKTNKVDVLFLDINLGNSFTGIQLAESILNKVEVVFTTAYPEYAIKGFELNVLDYLLKPISFERFNQTIDRIINRFETSSTLGNQSFCFVKTENRLEKIEFADIKFIEGMSDYRRIHLTTKKIMTLQTFGDFENQLPKEQFVRVHKSYMINVKHVDSIERDRIKIEDELIPISDSYRKEFYNLIGRK